MKSMLILSTCGTSVLTNGAAGPVSDVMRRHANSPDVKALGDDAALLKAHVAERARTLSATSDWTALARTSAEVNGVRALGVHDSKRRLHHVVVHTDTWLGREAAAIVAPTLERLGGTTEMLTGADLRTSTSAEFRLGMADLLEKLEATLPGYESSGWEIVFQLSGGFKSLNGFLQAYGMIRAHQCVYLFESSSELVRIPRLPVRLELDDFDPRWAGAFRRLAAGYPVTPEAMEGVPETLWATLEGSVLLTQWGDLLWASAKPGLMQASGLPALSKRLVVAPTVTETLRTRSPAERESANKSLDTVSAYLDGHRAAMPASSQLKLLEGRGPGGATHELYAWSSGGAWRFYGRLDKGTLYLDRLDEHL